MSWIILKQPNKLLACFSTIVDNLIAYNMDEAEAFVFCRDEWGVRVAQQKIKVALEDWEPSTYPYRSDAPSSDDGLTRWRYYLKIMQEIHKDDADLQYVLDLCRKPVKTSKFENSPKVTEALKKATEKLLNMPKEEFLKELEKHKDGDISQLLLGGNFACIEETTQELKKKRQDLFQLKRFFLDGNFVELVIDLSDTFAYACADCDTITADDLEELWPAVEKHGRRALIAYAAIKRKIEDYPILYQRYPEKKPKYDAALKDVREIIEADRNGDCVMELNYD